MDEDERRRIFSLSTVTIHFKNYYYNIQEPTTPVKSYYDRSIVLYASEDDSVRAHIKITKNEYKITNWIPFFSKPKVDTFYSIDKYIPTVRSIGFFSLAWRLVFEADNKINVFETTFLNFFDVLGTIGGTYEIVYLLSSLIFKVLVNSLFKSLFFKKGNYKSDEKEWFSYPPSRAFIQKLPNKKCKVANLKEGKTPNNDRSRHYQSYDQVEPEVSIDSYFLTVINYQSWFT